MLKIMLLCCLGDLWFLIMSQGQFSHFIWHLTVLEAGDDGKAGLESETSSEAKYVRNFVSGPRKKDDFKLWPNKKFSLKTYEFHAYGVLIQGTVLLEI